MRPHDIWCRVVLCRGCREFCGRVLSTFACARVSPCARELHASPRIVLVGCSCVARPWRCCPSRRRRRRRRADLAVALCALVVHSTNAFSSWWAQCWRLDASYLLAHAVVGLDLDLPATYVSPYMTPPPEKGALP